MTFRRSSRIDVGFWLWRARWCAHRLVCLAIGCTDLTDGVECGRCGLLRESRGE